ncbi:2OG-Fe dioxygenase family protein [Streptomyces eurythermus]|uniref:2OG-Fe dioxygenase family protein n=1 Tax=Streptomyces eurythermus TaxID=42237 RepID=UPI003F4D5815
MGPLQTPGGRGARRTAPPARPTRVVRRPFRRTGHIYADSGAHLLTTTLSEPGDLLLGDDRRTLHSVTPVHPVDPALPAHRDVLVIAYTAR